METDTNCCTQAVCVCLWCHLICISLGCIAFCAVSGPDRARTVGCVCMGDCSLIMPRRLGRQSYTNDSYCGWVLGPSETRVSARWLLPASCENVSQENTSTVILLFKNRVNSFCSLCIRWRWYLYAFLAVYETLWKLYESLQFWICFVLRVAKSLLWLFLHLKMKPKCLLFFLSFLSYFIL